MKFGIKILPKEAVLDSQGRAVQGALVKKGFSLAHCSVGKFIVLDIESGGLAAAKSMAEDLLVNPLIETYEIEELN